MRNAIALVGLLLASPNIREVAAADLTLPTPTGSAAVGTTTLYLVDRGHASRELMVTVWYPCSPEDARGGSNRYTDAETAKALAPELPLSSDFLASLRTHSFPRVGMRSGNQRYPVVVVEHGLGMVPVVYSVLAETLASRGFVVVAINHTFTSRLVVFPDGRSQVLQFPWRTDVDYQAQGKLMGEYLAVWVADVRFVLDSMEHLSEVDPFWRDRLDLSRVAVIGHSYGGTAAVEEAIADRRIVAAVDLDGSTYPGMGPPIRLSKPLLHMMTSDSDLNKANFLGAVRSTYFLTFPGAGHMSFTDLPVLEKLDGKQPRGYKDDALERTALVNSMICEFLEKYIRGALAPHLDAEVAVDRH
jgi:predicted dienelactone hydrolase